MKEITYAGSALKALVAITSAERERIVAKLEQYARDPMSLRNQIRAMKGVRALRLRVADYRVIFTEDQNAILVLKVGHRREVYD